MDEARKGPKGLNETPANEGEGNKTADKRYRDAATGFAKENPDSLKKGLEAEREVENYKDEYDTALRETRAHSAGEAPGDLKGTNDRKR